MKQKNNLVERQKVFRAKKEKNNEELLQIWLQKEEKALLQATKKTLPLIHEEAVKRMIKHYAEFINEAINDVGVQKLFGNQLDTIKGKTQPFLEKKVDKRKKGK